MKIENDSNDMENEMDYKTNSPMELSNEARKARNRYQSEYRRNNGRKPLTEIQREERNRYLREYRRKNPDKVKEYQNRYWEKKANETNQIFMQQIFSRS